MAVVTAISQLPKAVKQFGVVLIPNDRGELPFAYDSKRSGDDGQYARFTGVINTRVPSRPAFSVDRHRVITNGEYAVGWGEWGRDVYFVGDGMVVAEHVFEPSSSNAADVVGDRRFRYATPHDAEELLGFMSQLPQNLRAHQEHTAVPGRSWAQRARGLARAALGWFSGLGSQGRS